MSFSEVLIQIIMPILSAIGITSGGWMFYKSKKVQADSEGKQARVAADLAEINAYSSRIQSLSDQMTDLQAGYDDVLGQLSAALELVKTKDQVIDALQQKNAELQQALESIRQENEGLRQINSELQRRNQTLKATAAKIRKAAKTDSDSKTR